MYIDNEGSKIPTDMLTYLQLKVEDIKDAKKAKKFFCPEETIRLRFLTDYFAFFNYSIYKELL